MSGKPPKWRPDDTLQNEIRELKRQRAPLIKSKSDLYMAQPKVKFNPEQLKEHLAKRREMLDKYDKNIEEKDNQIAEKEKEMREMREKIATQGIASLTRRHPHGAKRKKTKRRSYKK
jgi:chromosome segregation ATPase